MANSSITLSSLDFDSLKSNFKNFLKTQSVFKDYDFDGSNINVLLDVMSYNSYLNAFYLNMVASEMFLDSAQKYDSAVSHAKELNYIPRSARSSAAKINLTLTSNVPNKKLIVPKGTKFNGFNSTGSYTFTTDETNVLISSNSTYTISGLYIYEGDYFTDSYVVDSNIESQQFILSNKNVDTNSITVNVVENGVESVFTRADNLYNLDEKSNVYFLQMAQNGQYEILFGDSLLGKKPVNGSLIKVEYRLCSGSESNLSGSIVLVDDLNLINDGYTVSVENVETVEMSSGGTDPETIESIKFAAPRYFSTQQRAISSDDYASLVYAKFGGEISDVIIYGGQDLEPKQYGRVVVCLKPSNGEFTPDYVKNNIKNYLIPYIAIPNRIILSDPDYLYCYVNSKVQYNNVIGEKTNSEVISTVLQALAKYSSSNLEKFGKDLRYSKLVSTIDNSDTNIASNDTELRIIKRITPLLRKKAAYKLETNNKIYVESNVVKTATDYETRFLYASFISSRFTFVYNGISYPLSFLEDDNKGNIKLYTILNEKLIELATVGSVNYDTGLIVLDNIYASEYDNHISLYMKPYNKDIFTNKNKILLIDLNDVNIKVSEVLG